MYKAQRIIAIELNHADSVVVRRDSIRGLGMFMLC